jgi:guanylate kinase
MSVKKHEKVVVIGKSGSGKDHLMRKLVERGLKPCLKTTTRPKRKFEHQGTTYNFISNFEFSKLIKENKFFSHQEFLVTPENSDPESWFYGITNEEFNSSQVFIMTPGECKNIPEEYRKDCFIVYLDIDRKVRESRLLKREDKNDSVIRRMDCDELDFGNFNDFDLRITDPEFTADEVYDLMF